MNEYLMYLRKSRQDNPDETVEEVLAKHERILQNFATNQLGHAIPEECIYREVVSGEMISDRPQVKALFRAIESSTIKGVLVVEPQRLSRGDLVECGTIVRYFKYSNTLIYTPAKIFNLKDDFDCRIFQDELMRGREYFEYSVRIMQRGTKQSILEGNYISPEPPYGYQKVKEGKKQYLIVDPVESEYVKMIYNLYLSGYGIKRIANKLNELNIKPRRISYWTQSSILRILGNQVYTGCIVWNRRKRERILINGEIKKKDVYQEKPIIVEDTHEAIIDKETFQKVQELKGKAPRISQGTTFRNTFRGLLRCAVCNHAMKCQVKADGSIRYFCPQSSRCGCYGTTEKTITEEVIKGLKQHLNDFEVDVQTSSLISVKQHETILSELESTLASLEERQQKLYEYLEHGSYTEKVFIERNRILNEERISLNAQIEAEKQKLNEPTDTKQIKATLHEAISLLEDDTVSAYQKNQFLRSFISVIRYKKTVRLQNNKKGTVLSDNDLVSLEIVLK